VELVHRAGCRGRGALALDRNCRWQWG
jgi:hypothetical protein